MLMGHLNVVVVVFFVFILCNVIRDWHGSFVPLSENNIDHLVLDLM